VTNTLLLTLLIFVAALLYSSVGHAGASGYLAAMALFNLAPDVMKPTALVLNLNGNAITLSELLWSSGVRDGETLRENALPIRAISKSCSHVYLFPETLRPI